MQAYYFTTADFGIEAIKRRRLKIARIHELNDPFEFLGVELIDRDFRKAVHETKDALSKNNGLLCFSRSWKHPMLWAHYAEKHMGLCLGFEVGGELEPVTYVNSRFPRPADLLAESFVKKLLYTKFAHWSYEDEYRLYVKLEDEENGLYFMPFSDQLRLNEIYVGARSQVTRGDLKDALRGTIGRVKVCKTRPAFNDFRITRQKDDRLWC